MNKYMKKKAQLEGLSRTHKMRKSNPVVLLRLPPYIDKVENEVITKLCYVSGIGKDEKIGQLPTSSAERWAGTDAKLICSDKQRDKVQSLIDEGVNTLYIKVGSYLITHSSEVIIYPAREPNEILSISRATHQWEECFVPIYKPQEELGEGEKYIVYYADPKRGFEKEPLLCSTNMSLNDILNSLKDSKDPDCIYISRVDDEGVIESYSYNKELILKR